MRRIIGIFALLAIPCLVGGSIDLTQAQVTKGELKEQMRLKLLHTQDVLSGIAMEDFSQIEKGANGLVEVCRMVGWTEGKTKGKFETHDIEFHNVAHELVDLAKAKNLEGAHYKYIQMTTICMDCHKHVRDTEKEAHKGESLKEERHIHSR